MRKMCYFNMIPDPTEPMAIFFTTTSKDKEENKENNIYHASYYSQKIKKITLPLSTTSLSSFYLKIFPFSVYHQVLSLFNSAYTWMNTLYIII